MMISYTLVKPSNAAYIYIDHQHNNDSHSLANISPLWTTFLSTLFASNYVSIIFTNTHVL